MLEDCCSWEGWGRAAYTSSEEEEVQEDSCLELKRNVYAQSTAQPLWLISRKINENDPDLGINT